MQDGLSQGDDLGAGLLVADTIVVLSNAVRERECGSDGTAEDIRAALIVCILIMSPFASQIIRGSKMLPIGALRSMR